MGSTYGVVLESGDVEVAKRKGIFDVHHGMMEDQCDDEAKKGQWTDSECSQVSSQASAQFTNVTP